MYDLNRLDDTSLLVQLKALASKDSALSAELLAHVGEVDARKLYLEHACSSMFTYCVERLNFSEGEAYKRIYAARAARKHPLIFELVASGALHVSGITVLAPELTDDNHRELLAQASFKSKRAIEELVRARAPKPDVPELIRKLPGPPEPSLFSGEVKGSIPPAPKPPPPPIVAPLAEDRFKLQLTVSRRLKEKIDTAKALLRHRIPHGNLEDVLDVAIDELLAALMKKKFALTAKPKSETAPAENRTRYIPAAVRRAVAKRDALQCSFISADGHRCTERAFLELDHKAPFGKGGEHSVENLRLRCRAHNAHHAEREYGKAFLEQKKRRPSVSVHKDSCPEEQLSFCP